MRLLRDGSDIHNWQLLTDTEFEELMKDALENTVIPIINSPLTVLGKKREIWRGCVCPRDKCAVCFVEKNLWEAKQDEG